MDTSMSSGVKRKISSSPVDSVSSGTKRRKSGRSSLNGTDSQNDCYCWICHKEGEVICCETCPRVFHLKCIQLDTAPTEDWVCPECVLIMTAENMDTRSRAMRLLSVDQLCTLLKHALTRLRNISGVDPFVRAVDPIQFPAYRDYITCPMDLLTLEKNIRKKQYGSTEAFLADLKWILHNCIIFNSMGSKLTTIAKQLVKICKHEMQEIENCPDCYMNAHTKKDSWFIAACRIPHLLVWAKLKGFPFWPAKAMRVNSEDHVDVRFFGAHDRAWVPVRDVFIYSQEPPVPMKNKKKGNFEGCVKEVELYIRKITEKFGEFEYASSRTPFDSKREEEQIKLLYPKCTLPFDLGPIRTRARSLSFSGSERSHSRTPTPIEDESRVTKIGETLDEEQLQETKKMVPPTSVKITQPLKEAEIEEDDSKLELEADDEEEVDDVEEEVDDVEPESVEQPKLDKKAVSTSDRVAASPPCEVSSTTTSASDTTSNAGKQPSETQANKSAVEETSKPEPKLAVIAETSETVIIEGDEDEEEEVDDDEEAVINDAEIDDVEPEAEGKNQSLSREKTSEVDKDSLSEESSPPKEDSYKTTTSDEGKVDKNNQDVEMTSENDDSTSNVEESPEVKEKSVSREEEIDDVGPEAVDAEEDEINDVEEIPVEPSKSSEDLEVESKSNENKKDNTAVCSDSVDTSRLLASGVSVTIKSKPVTAFHSKKSQSLSPEASADSKNDDGKIDNEKQKVSESDDPKDDLSSELSLGSDISVTVVQKKKDCNVSIPPRISVKKESELLAGSSDKPRDIVHVSRTRKATPTQIRKSVDESEGDKNPPDPIVTISKVQALVSGVSSSKPETLKNAPPLTSQQSRKSSNAPSTTSVNHSVRTSSSSNGPLVNMLGAPRMIPPPHHQHRGRAMSQNSIMRGGPPVSGQSGHPMGMPSLHPRPQGLFSVPPPLPSAAGPVSEQLNRVAGKLVDYMRLSLEELFREMASSGSPEATIKALQIEIEKIQWRHQQELAETRHNAELKFQELQHAMEAEKQKIISDLKKQAELEKQKAVTEAKKKQWCSHCGKEAIFYCCWNTSYCDYPCQQAHWPTHMSTCAQNQANNDEDGLNVSGNNSSASEISQSHSSEPVEHNSSGHFLSTPSGPGPSRSQSNGIIPPHTRGMQPMMMPFGPSGINPRLMSQMGMRFCGPHPATGPPPRGGLPAHLRFPGNYFM